MGPPCLPGLRKCEPLWGEPSVACANCPLLTGEDRTAYCSPTQRASRVWSQFTYKVASGWIALTLTAAVVAI